VITASAKAEQTCNFQIVGPNADTTCNNQASCVLSTGTEQMNCGRSDIYQVKVNGSQVLAIFVICNMCPG
jgi:hypothetical protein